MLPPLSEVPAVDWSQVHADFPINRSLVWLNNCGIAPPPGPVIDSVRDWLSRYAARGIFAGESDDVVHRRVTGRLARLLGVSADELALVHNTAEGMTFLSHGFDLQPGDRILLLDHEYPSNVYPWQHWREKGVHLDFAPPGRTPDECLAAFTAALTPRTRVASLSAVHWCTGLPVPLGAIAALCEDRGVELVVDGAQGVGLLPLDFSALRIGYAAFSAWKWLLGPLGLGALYIRRDKLGGLRFPFKGTSSVVDDEAYLPYRDELKPTTARYVLSTPNFNDWIYFDHSLAYLERLGFAPVMDRICGLAAQLSAGLVERGFHVASAAHPHHPTGILSVHKDGHDADALLAGLKRAGVVAAVRLRRLRLAPHVYLSESQIDGVVDTLAKLTS